MKNDDAFTTFLSPAKINLFLRVISRRPDGFHELATLMQAIDLADTITITPSQQDTFTCSDPTLPIDDKNLVVRALRLFRKQTSTTHPFSIHLEKRIPHQAGLGGGSSNAATTLWALNELNNTNLPISTLSQWGAELGSDVPFFFSTGTAFCKGRGEQVQNLPTPSLPPLTIYKPSIGLSTPSVFRALDLSDCDARDSEELLEQFMQGEFVCTNDLQAPAYSLVPELQNLHDELLNAGHQTALLSGSGTSLFALGLPARSPNTDATAYPCKPLQRDPDTWYTAPIPVAAIPHS